MMENNETLASELIHEIKAQSKRKDAIIILLICIIFSLVVAWIISYNLPQDEILTESYEMQGDSGSNVFYNGQGEVQINEPN